MFRPKVTEIDKRDSENFKVWLAALTASIFGQITDGVVKGRRFFSLTAGKRFNPAAFEECALLHIEINESVEVGDFGPGFVELAGNKIALSLQDQKICRLTHSKFFLLSSQLLLLQVAGDEGCFDLLTGPQDFDIGGSNIVLNEPATQAAMHVPVMLANQAAFAMRHRCPGALAGALALFVRRLPLLLRERRPLRPSTFRLYRRLARQPVPVFLRGSVDHGYDGAAA